MFVTLLVVTFPIAVLVSFIVVRTFDQPFSRILNRIVSEEIASAWVKFLEYAIYVVGVSGGVRAWDLEKHITPEAD